MSKKYEPARLISVAFVALIIAFFIVQLAEAQDNRECRGNQPCNDQVGPPVISEFEGDRLLALSNSLGGVDISGCIVTKQWSVIVFAKQGYEYDPWCLASILDENGKYKEAAVMRCTDKETARIYGQDCTIVLNFEPSESQGLVRDEWDDDWEERYFSQQEEIEAVKEELAVVTKQAQMKTIDDGAERRARARAARDEVLEGKQ